MRQRYNLSFRREQQKKERTRKLIAIVVIIFVFAVLGTLIYFAFNNINWGSLNISSSTTDNKKTTAVKEKSTEVDITINSVGEVGAYRDQLNAAKGDDGYDFNSSFEDIKKYTKKADLSLVDLETTLAGEPYTGYPKFNAPDELADALDGAGFDVAVTANEHALDSDAQGVEKTIDALEAAGLKSTGTRKDPGDKNYLITKVNGVQIGIVAYTEETSFNSENRTLDGSSMSEEEQELVNSYSPNVDNDLDQVQDTMEAARDAGAQIVICYFHWGDDYDHDANDQEKEIVKSLVDMGADMIFATHPHVAQEMETVENEDGVDVPVYYSLGNFFTAQRSNTVGDRATEQGMIAQVKLTYNTEENKITAMDNGYIGTWVNKYTDVDTNKNVYKIMPLVGDLEGNELLESTDSIDNAKQALEDLIEKLGDPIKTKADKDADKSQSESDSNSSDADRETDE